MEKIINKSANTKKYNENKMEKYIVYNIEI